MAASGLAGRVALVTGAVEGIGWATASTLARAGATVVLAGRVDDERLAARASELRDGGFECDPIAADVTDPAAVSACFRHIQQTHGRLDVAVANAGVLGDARIGMIGEDLLRQTLETNLSGSIRQLQGAARLMTKARSGSIVLLSSIVGRRGNVGQVAYAASKAALHGVVRSAAKELGPAGVRVNAVAPGYVRTRMIAHLPPEVDRERVDAIPMGRPGEAQDVANAVLFLASDLSSYVTGQVIGVDGGMVM